MSYKLEVIAFDIESCVIAETSGAHRIELCSGPGEGGTTASAGFIKKARNKTSIELYPIIRPRGGDFLYTDDEFEIMKTDIRQCKSLGCDGIVTGLLLEDGKIDMTRTSQLVQIAYPMGVTFHRAFDRCADPMEGLEAVIQTGCERILTSGQMPQAADGIPLIATLISQATHRIIIMPGSGIRPDNIASIAEQTRATEFHSSARKLNDSKMTFNNRQMQENLQNISIDDAAIKAMINALSGNQL